MTLSSCGSKSSPTAPGPGITASTGYSAADLQGAWQRHAFVSGPGAPWWERAHVVITSGGHLVGTATDNTGSSRPINGVLGITPTGIVTLNGSTTFKGVLDAGRTVLVGSDKWPNGTVEMKVFVRVK